MSIGLTQSYCFHDILGEKLVNFMAEPKKGVKWPKTLPKFKSRQEAIAVCKDLCKYQFIHRSEKISKGQLDVSDIVFLRCKNLGGSFSFVFRY